MYVIDKMKLNKFIARPVVSNRELFVGKGGKSFDAAIQSKDTIACVDDPSIEGASKTKVLGFAQEILDAAAAKKASDGKSPDLQKSLGEL